MKFLIYFGILCVLFWYGSNNWGWMDWWTKAESGFWYEVQQTFSQENVEMKRQMRQKKIDSMY